MKEKYLLEVWFWFNIGCVIYTPLLLGKERKDKTYNYNWYFANLIQSIAFGFILWQLIARI